MTDYVKPTGTHGELMIRDLGSHIQFFLRHTDQTTPFITTPNIPWAASANGETVWKSYRPGLVVNYWHSLGYVYVEEAQLVKLLIGDSNTTQIGGPTEFSVYIRRGITGSGQVIIRVGDRLKAAIPYVKENGTWKLAEPWARNAGLWKHTR